MSLINKIDIGIVMAAMVMLVGVTGGVSIADPGSDGEHAEPQYTKSVNMDIPPVANPGDVVGVKTEQSVDHLIGMTPSMTSHEILIEMENVKEGKYPVLYYDNLPVSCDFKKNYGTNPLGESAWWCNTGTFAYFHPFGKTYHADARFTAGGSGNARVKTGSGVVTPSQWVSGSVRIR